MTRIVFRTVLIIIAVSTGAFGQPDSLIFYQDVSWSPDGSRLLLSRMVIEEDSFPSSIVSVGVDGSDFRFVTSGPKDKWTSWSPDGSRIVYSSEADGNVDIYVRNTDDGAVARLTNDPGIDSHPDWSPDGSSIAFAAKRGVDVWQIFVMKDDGTGQQQLTDGPGDKWNPRWSPDGKRIVFYGSSEPGKDSMFVMRHDGSKMTPLGPGIWPSWSPDSTHILFVDAGNTYRMKSDGTDRRFMVAKTIFAKWSNDGVTIAFIQETWRAQQGWPAKTALFLINTDGSGRRKVTEQ